MTKEDQKGAERVWFRLVRLNARMGAAMSERLRTIGLSVPQYDVLATLTEREGVSQQELAERLYVTKGNISGLIDRLVAAALVERRATAGDRRSHAIFLTDRGADLARRGLELQRAFVSETIGRLDRQQVEQFESMIVTVRNYARAAAASQRGEKVA